MQRLKNALSNQVPQWHNIGEKPTFILNTSVNVSQLHQTRGTSSGRKKIQSSYVMLGIGEFKSVVVLTVT